MPPRPRRRMSVARPGARRKLVWATSSGVNQTAGSGGFSVDLLANLRVAGSSVLGSTIIRTHIDVSLIWAAVTPVTGNGVGIGLAIEDTDLIAAGDVVIGAAGRDWMLRQNWLPGTGLNQVSIVSTSPVEGFRVDLRSKRKVQELNQTLGFFVQSLTASGIPFSYFARTLIALP